MISLHTAGVRALTRQGFFCLYQGEKAGHFNSAEVLLSSRRAMISS